MTVGHLNLKTILVPVVTILMLTACGTTAPTRFYILHPLPTAETATAAASSETVSIALSPVNLPEHLKRSQIVTRQAGHQVRVDEFNRWAEPLDASFTMIMAENLSQLLGTDRISVSSRVKYGEYDYNLSIDVIRFDGQISADANLICRWSLYRGDGKTALALKRSSFNRQVEGSDYQDLVAAMSLLVGDLGREIAGQIIDFK